MAQNPGSHHHVDAGNVRSKTGIMEIYLNVIEWGSGVFGAEAAIRSITVFPLLLSPRHTSRSPRQPWFRARGSTIVIALRRGY